MLSGIFSTGDKEEKYAPTTDAQRLGAAFVLARRRSEADAGDRGEAGGPRSPADEAYHKALQATSADEALAHIDESLREEPGHADALLLRAWIHCQLGEPQEMLADAETVLAGEPQNADAQLARSAALLQLGKTSEAQAALDTVAEELKNDYRVFLFTGLIADREKQADRALVAFGRALQLNPQSVLALQHSAQLNLAQGYAELALADLDRVVAAEPRNAEAYGLRGECLDRLKRYREAVTNYKRALEISGQLSWALKLTTAAWNADQEDRAASESQEPESPPVDAPDDLRKQDVVPAPPPAADAGGVYQWWQSFLNGTRKPQDASGSFAPRLDAQLPY